jgi:Domain of unknown function (DUF1996)
MKPSTNRSIPGRRVRPILAACLVALVAVPIARSSVRSADAAPISWQRCAGEFEYCSFTGLRDVRYVKNGVATNATAYETLGCHPAYFAATDTSPGSAYCEYSSTYQTATLRNPMPGMAGLPETVTVPVGKPPATSPLLKPTDDRGVANDIGAFRVTCGVSHFSFDDPVVYPGQPGKAHLHMFFGNSGTNASSTTASLTTTGGSTCSGGTLNRSAYWVPAMIDGTGQVVMPTSQIFYYKTGYNGIAPADVQAPPTGLRMIAGTPTSTSDTGQGTWGCIETYIPTTATIQEMAAKCGAGNHLNMAVTFPQCSNGKLDSGNHMRHLADPVNGSCPSTHPTPMPVISFNVRFQIPDDLAAGWHLSSDMYDYNAKGGGLTAHADWYNGWHRPTLNTWIQNCSQASRDCHADLLGNGTVLS